MSVTVLVLAALVSTAAPAAVQNQNDCWQDSGTSGPKAWGRYDYHLVNRCDREIRVWDAVVFWRDDGTAEQWSCGHRTKARDEDARFECRPRSVRPGGTVSFSARSGRRYWYFACYADNAECNELAKEWANDVHGLPISFDPGEIARRTGF